jgi:hypothetical protein
MIELPELLVVLGVFALMGGYVAFIRYLLAHADGNYKVDSNGSRRNNS